MNQTVVKVNQDHQTERAIAKPLTALWKRYWLAGFRYIISVTTPDCKLAPTSKVPPDQRGKAPGEQRSDGLWVGLADWTTPNPALERVKRWSRTAANIGMLGITHAALDGDIDDAEAAQKFRERAERRFCFTCVRIVEGRSRFLMVLRTTKPTGKRRIAFTLKGQTHVIEWLGAKQQYLVEGIHKSGVPYRWENGAGPCEWGDKIPMVPDEDIDAFFDEDVPAVVAELGGTIIGRQGCTSSGGARIRLDDPERAKLLRAPSGKHVIDAIEHIKLTDENFNTRYDAVRLIASVKASLGPHAAEFMDDVLDWWETYPNGDADYFFTMWESIDDAELGWSWLLDKAREHGYEEPVEEVFDDEIAKEAAADIAKNPSATDKMMDDYAYILSQKCFCHLPTSSFLDAGAFNTENVHVAKYGKSGMKTAEAIYKNHPRARLIATITSRAGQPVLTKTENESGVTVGAVNTWRPSNVKPAKDVSDTQLAPYLDLVEKLFGPRGTPVCEYILDWIAYLVQNPGKKIGHAPLIIGPHGVGKDTVLAPLFESVGQHNVKAITTDDLVGPFNFFLKAKVIYVQEASKNAFRDAYTRLKPFISGQKTQLVVNEKGLRQYSIPNEQIWIFTSNYDDAIALEDGDRRFLVCQVLAETPEPPEYFEALYKWYDKNGYELVYGWLLQRDVSRFKPLAPPPMTSAKQAMIEQAQPEEVRWLRNQLRDGGPLASRAVLTVGDLTGTAQKDCFAPDVNHKHAAAALKTEGFKTAPALRVRIGRGRGGDVRQLWVRDPSGELSRLTPDELREQYLAEGENPQEVDW